MRRGREVARWLVRAGLPVAVCFGLLVMHGLDRPASHGVEVGLAQPAVASAVQVGAEHGGATDDHHCTGCIGSLHLVVVCVAVLATMGLALSWRRLSLGAAALADVALVRGAVISAVRPNPRARPAWVRLAVMLC